jgi:hypothetical protein
MMTPRIILFTLGFTALVASAQSPTQPSLKLFLNEVQPGALAASQYCTLVFADRRFHSEKADIKHGVDSSRKIYEGQLSDNEWNSLVAIIDSPGFRDMKVPRTVPPLVMQDTHPYTISVARDKDFQNMEFLDSKSLKPYESQVKPLLQWWKPVRSRHMSESTASASPQCALDSNHAVYAQ